MKKIERKWFLYFIALIPLMVIIVFLFFFEINIKATITIIVFCIILFVFSIVVIKQREKINASSLKRRKVLLAALGFYIVFLLVLSLICDFYGINIWQNLFSNVGVWLQFILLIAIFLYGFFRKEKMSE
jgi:amino acid transporter